MHEPNKNWLDFNVKIVLARGFVKSCHLESLYLINRGKGGVGAK